ncbi:MAG: glycosyltransferase, partial [Polyangiaceae bacterium]
MRVVLTSMFTAGDVLPFLRLARAMRLRGHDVALVTHVPYRSRAEASDIAFGTWDTPASYDALLADGLEFDTPAGFQRIYRHHVVPSLAAEIRALQEHTEGDAILITRCGPALAARCVAEQRKIPLVELYLGPGHLTPPSMLAAMVRPMVSEIDAARSDVGLPAIADLEAWLGTANARIGTWPAWFAPRAAEWGSLELTGFLMDDETEAGVLPDETLRFLDAGAPPVLIAGGTGKFFTSEFFARCIEACRRSDRRALLVTPFADLVPKDLGGDAMRASHLSFSSVMSRVAAVIHHGGIGTSFQALRAAAPQLVLGIGGDRPENARQLARLGVGTHLPKSRWDQDSIAQALGELLSSRDVKQACARAAAQLTDGRASTSDCIEALMHPSKTRARRPACSAGERVTWREGWVHEQIERHCREDGSR